jgi:hypothetical protein
MHRKRLALRVIGSVLIAAAARGQATSSLSRKSERNGVIWTVGWDMDQGRRVFNVMKRFDPSGVLLSTSRMTVKPLPMPLDWDVSLKSHLQSSADRVGWLTGAGLYLEFSLNVVEIGRFEAPPWHPEKLWVGPNQSLIHGLPVYVSLALSQNNQVVVAGESPISALWALNRDARQWVPVNVSEGMISQSGRLLGFDGDELIVDYLTSDRGEMVGRFSLSSGN